MTELAGTAGRPGEATGTVLEGRYELRQPLGRGGMATVYRAHDRRLDRPVAVKLLDAPGAQPTGAAWREDRLAAALSHPHIVAIYDSGTAPDGRSYLVMELVEGQPLGRLAPLPPDRALALAEQLADALAHAHARGIVHCDLTPRNVLVDAAGRARLTDFGVASAAAAPVEDLVYGTAAYLAPERLRGAPTSPAVDIYALGAVLYYLLVGRPPYVGVSSGDVIDQVLAGPPPPLRALAPTVSPVVDALVRRALAHDPADRFPDAESLQRALVEARQAIVRRPSRAGVIARRVALQVCAVLASWLRQLAGLGRGAGGASRPHLARGPVRLGIALAILLVALVSMALAPRLRGGASEQTAARGEAAAATEQTAGASGTPAPLGQPALSPATAPSPTAAAPARLTAPAGPIRAEAVISDPAPRRTARLTLTGRLLRGDAGIAGVPMRSVWHFRSGDATCDSRAGTDAEGRATCVFTMSGAAPGREVVVDVLFEYEGRSYRVQVRFTPH